MCLACEEQEYFFRLWCADFLARGHDVDRGGHDRDVVLVLMLLVGLDCCGFATFEPDDSVTVLRGGCRIVTALPFWSRPVIGTLKTGGSLRCGSGVWKIPTSAGSGPQPSTGPYEGATYMPAIPITRVCGYWLS